MTTEENQGHPHMIITKPGDPKMPARATEPIIMGSRQTPTLHRDGVATGTPPSNEFSNPYEREAEVNRRIAAQKKQDRIDNNKKMMQSDNARKGGVETPTVKTKKAAKPPSEKFTVTKTKTKAKATTKAKAKPKAKSPKSTTSKKK